jgi:formate dehydrogenase subunit gamma
LKFALALMLLLLIYLPLTLKAAGEFDRVEKNTTDHRIDELWRAVQQHDQQLNGISQVEGIDNNNLINGTGDLWARFRVNEIVSYAKTLLIGSLVVILIGYAIRGRVKVEGGLSGAMLRRFSDYEKIAHWLMALVFLFLAITGLILLLGRTVLIPLLGKELFSLFALASKESHNLFGPISLLSVLMMLVRFGKKNLYEKGDLIWLLKGGGLFGKSHLSAGFFNTGEKLWFWIVILVGLVISVSGLILVLPNLGQARDVILLSQVLHVGGVIVLIALSIRHIYLGSIGMQAVSEGMRSGYVDINWAQVHHNRWAEACRESDLTVSAEEFARLQGNPAPLDREINK